MSKIRSTRKSRRMVRNNRRYFLKLALTDYNIFYKLNDVSTNFIQLFYQFGLTSQKASLSIKDFADAICELQQDRVEKARDYIKSE